VLQENDLRRYARVTSSKGTFLAWSTTGRGLVSRIDNFALGGMFISVADPLSPGSYIQLLFDVLEGEIRARAVACRSSPNKGMAIRFVSMQPEERTRLGRWLNNLSAN